MSARIRGGDRSRISCMAQNIEGLPGCVDNQAGSGRQPALATKIVSPVAEPVNRSMAMPTGEHSVLGRHSLWILDVAAYSSSIGMEAIRPLL
jgi:hypothetical protein